jgi:hypothetical protein
MLLAVQVVRNAAVAALAGLRPAAAARLWPGHPEVETSLAMLDIGRAAHERRPIGRATLAVMREAALKAPLSPQPFLVRGVEADVAGDHQAAVRAYLAAQWRDPRSLPAAYFLANHYLRSGDAYRGLQQTSLLARLSPGATAAAAPFVATYARNRSNWPGIRALFRSQPEMEDAVLAVLARDPSNAEAIFAVSDPGHRRRDSAWLATLLNSMVADGQYERAREIWSRIAARGARGQLVYDAAFTSADAPPPFNWALASSGTGLAERQPGRRLHVIFYGNHDGVLASQLVILPPGAYRLRLQLVGAPLHPEELHWSIRCDRTADPISSAPINEVARRGWTFEVPRTCSAQWLELSGRSGDFAEQAEAIFTGFTLTRVGANA